MEIYPAFMKKLDRFCEPCGMPMKDTKCKDCGSATVKRDI